MKHVFVAGLVTGDFFSLLERYMKHVFVAGLVTGDFLIKF